MQATTTNFIHAHSHSQKKEEERKKKIYNSDLPPRSPIPIHKKCTTDSSVLHAPQLSPIHKKPKLYYDDRPSLHSQFMSSVTVDEMGAESLKLVARHSKTACRSFLESLGTTRVVLMTPGGERDSWDDLTSSLTSHCTTGVGRPGGGERGGGG